MGLKTWETNFILLYLYNASYITLYSINAQWSSSLENEENCRKYWYYTELDAKVLTRGNFVVGILLLSRYLLDIKNQWHHSNLKNKPIKYNTLNSEGEVLIEVMTNTDMANDT